MKETIEAWAYIDTKGTTMLRFNKEDAEALCKKHGGTVVRLTGEMPKKPIERKTTAWVQTSKPFLESKHAFDRLGIVAIAEGETDKCQTKVEITVKEVVDE